MRCLACNRELSNKEATRRDVTCNNFLDMCDHCYRDIRTDVPTYINPLFADDEAEKDDEEYEDKHGEM